jgi:hypothetical protein
MPILIVTSKIDGNPVAWRCSGCLQAFSIPGPLSGDQRRKKIAAEFRIHLQQSHPQEPRSNKGDPGPPKNLASDEVEGTDFH